jgi:hypothetical protein
LLKIFSFQLCNVCGVHCDNPFFKSSRYNMHPLPFNILFIFLPFKKKRVLPCSPHWPWTFNPPVSDSWVLRFQACVTTFSFTYLCVCVCVWSVLLGIYQFYYFFQWLYTFFINFCLYCFLSWVFLKFVLFLTSWDLYLHKSCLKLLILVLKILNFPLNIVLVAS